MKPMRRFPQSCDGCDGVYNHWDSVKLYSGGCMKSSGNTYCTKGRRHFKLLKRDLYGRKPSKCPILMEHPIPQEDEDEDI